MADNFKDKDVLRHLYIDEKLSIYQIGNLFEVAPKVIHYWLKKFDISRRKSGGRKYKSIELNEKILYELYCVEELSIRAIAKKYQIHHETVRYWLVKYNIAIRDRIDALRTDRFKTITSEMRSGEKHHGWLGGWRRKDYGPEFNLELKRKIRKRDFYTCQICGIKQKDYWRKLDVHHIDYNKKNHIKENLISLCQRCHIFTNTNREEWIDYFSKRRKGIEVKTPIPISV